MTDKKESDKKWLIGIAVAAAIIMFLTLGKGLLSAIFTTGEGDGSKILYHTLTCPHCQNVKEYIKEKGITGIVEKEVSVDREIIDEFRDRLVGCGEDVSQGMPIPVLWAEGKCFIGEDEVINYFESSNNEQAQ